jgi:nucleotide-binding universal stress UspA family protein
LACYDGTDDARRAIVLAESCCRGWKAVVLHLHAVSIADEGSELAVAVGLHARPLAAGIGSTWQRFSQSPSRRTAHLIVTGAHTMKGARASFGSLSLRVAQHSTVPVLLG